MSQYEIKTDAVSQVIEAATADAAAAQFATTEKFYKGCQTVSELSARADELGGWATVEKVS